MYRNVHHAKQLVFMSCLVLSAVLLFAVFFTGRAAAFDTGWSTPVYDVRIKASKDNSYEYTEKITVDFSSPKHGVYRYIPRDDDTYKISDISVKGAEADISSESDYKVIRIGSSDRTVTGRHTYVIRYKIAFYEDQNDSADQMYIDVLPTSWKSSIGRAHVVIDLPSDMDLSDVKTFTGTYGSTDGYYGSWDISESDHRIVFSGKDLPTGVGASVRVTLPDGYWQHPLTHAGQAAAATVIFGAAAAAMLVLFVKRRKAGQIVEPVEFYAPEGITPTEAGYLIDGRCDPKDVSAMVFYMADKGFITISGDGSDEKGIKIRSVKIPENEDKISMRFYIALFGHYSAAKGKTGKTVTLEDMKKNVGSAYNSIKSITEDKYSGENDLYSRSSKRAGYLAMTAYFVAVVAGLVIMDGLSKIIFYIVGATLMLLLLAGLNSTVRRRYSSGKAATGIKTVLLGALYVLLGFLICAFLGMNGWSWSIVPQIALAALFVMSIPAVLIGPSMTDSGRELIGRLRGFRNFIRDAELDKLEELVEQDPEYFYGVLPYAYVFGLTKKWAEKFESIPVSQPGWYESTGGTGMNYLFDLYIFDSITRDITAATVSQISRNISDIGGGGFSGGAGGGFSGGGGGGGGGGAW